MMHDPRAGDESFPARAASRLAAAGLAVLAFFPLANLLTPKRYAPWYALTLVYWIVAGGALLLVLYLVARGAPGWLERLERAAGRVSARVSSRWIVGGAALFAFVAALVIWTVCFNRQPQDVDEAAQLWQAKILLSGRLSLPADATPEFFVMDDTIFLGRWYAQYTVGAPALLALGLALRAPWLLNPLLLALAVVGTYTFARRAYGEDVARTAAVLTALSPFALFMAASYMSYVPLIALTTLALTALAAWTDVTDARTERRAASLVGLALGLAFLVRPMDAVVLGAAIGVMQLVRVREEPSRPRIASLGWELLVGAVLVGLQLCVNARTTGSPFVFGYDVLYGPANRPGFHVDPYGVMHTPARALSYASKYVLQLNSVLFEWPLPVFGFVVAAFLVLRRPTRWDWFLLGLIALQLLAAGLFWSEGMFRGPRYVFTAVPAVIVLVARAIFVLLDAPRGTMRRMVPFIVPVCVAFTWLAIWSSASLAGRMRMYRRAAAATRVDPQALAREHGVHDAVVFVNQDAKNRALHRLWALGLTQGDAVRLLASAPLCGVRLAIDAEESQTPRRVEGRLQRLVDQATQFDERAPLPPACANDLRRDAAGVASYTQFYPANTIDSTGHVGGDVVYAIDLGERNDVLRQRFGSRTWYRFGGRLEPYRR